MPFAAGPSRPPDPMNVILRLRRQVVIQHQFDSRHIDPPRYDIRRHQNAVFTRFKSVQRLAPLAQRSIGMNLRRTVAHLMNRMGDFARPVLGARKNQGRTRILGQDLFEQSQFGLFGNDINFLGDAGHCGPRGRNLDADGQFHVGGGDRHNLRRHRGGKKHRLPLFGHARQDRLDLGQKSHIEHPVRFVQNQNGHLAQKDRPLLEMIVQPSRRRNNHVRISAHRRQLGPHGGAADEHRGSQSDRSAHLVQFRIHLQSQFARGQEHQPVAAAVRQPLEHRNPKRQRLPGPRLRDPDDIFPLDRHRYALMLDRRRRRVLQLVQRLNKRRRDPQPVKFRAGGLWMFTRMFVCHGASLTRQTGTA